MPIDPLIISELIIAIESDFHSIFIIDKLLLHYVFFMLFLVNVYQHNIQFTSINNSFTIKINMIMTLQFDTMNHVCQRNYDQKGSNHP